MFSHQINLYVISNNEHRRGKRWTDLLCSPASHLLAKSQGAAAPVPALVGRESPVVFEDRLLRAQWGGRARKDAVVTKVTSVDSKLSEGYKVTSVRSLACGQATAPKEDEQGAQRWWAVRKGVCHGGARECAMGENVR